MSELTDQLRREAEFLVPGRLKNAPAVMLKAADRIDALEAALKAVKAASAVCADFELCKHESCNASYTQYAIADKALREASL